jgi:hypothetical protein
MAVQFWDNFGRPAKRGLKSDRVAQFALKSVDVYSDISNFLIPKSSL